MRSALPNAAFIGFTGTPLMAGEETHEARSSAITSRIYNFKAVRRRQRNRPALLREPHPRTPTDQRQPRPTTSPRSVDAADLDDDQERKLEKEFAREYHLITRDDRLDRSRRRHRGALHGPWRSRQGDGHLHRQGHSGADVRQGSGRTGRSASPSSRQELHAGRSDLDKPELRRSAQVLRERRTWPWSSRRHRTRLRTFKKKGLDITRHRRRHGEGRIWRPSSRTPTIRFASSSSAPCGSPASMCHRAPPSTSTSR